MELTLLNTSFEKIKVIDSFKSLIWVERYRRYGDFELSTFINDDNVNSLKKDLYLTLSGSDKVMIIEDIFIRSNIKTGNSLVIRGVSLEALLYRRIVWSQTTITGNMQTGLVGLINAQFYRPDDETRQFGNFRTLMSSDTRITAMTIDTQFTGDYIYDVVENICSAHDLGFKVTLDPSSSRFFFTLYKGQDRSYGQLDNPYVIFSPEFGNLLNSEYSEINSLLKTVTLVAGEGEGADRVMVAIDIGGPSYTGINRREHFTDARDLSRSLPGGLTMPLAQYQLILAERGLETLSGRTFMRNFDGEIIMTPAYTYNVDFGLGDIVQIENEYGQKSKSKVMEFVYSIDPSGIKAYPLFSGIS